MVKMGTKNGWKLGPRIYFADDHCVGQTYLELYGRRHDERMIARVRERFAFILEHPKDRNLDFELPDKIDRWSWCDSPFMAPPTWLRLYAVTQDRRFLGFAVEQWWETSDFLYDRSEYLYLRDSTYFNRREANGRRVFWSRGNGWVLAALARIIPLLPADHPARPRFIQQFCEIAHAALRAQQGDGLWRTSLLDPASYPDKETSGSGFFCFALAWGVNERMLPAQEFRPAVDRAWAALTDCVTAEGKLTHVQPPGKAPKSFDPDNTEPFGVGAFLLAGSEVYRQP